MVKAIMKDIEKAKAKLLKTTFCENFGQDEIRELKQKYSDYKYTNDYILIENFEDWCMNYTPYRFIGGIK